ncbi:MAG: hypothetical protein ABDH21_04095 [bacterium]
MYLFRKIIGFIKIVWFSVLLLTVAIASIEQEYQKIHKTLEYTKASYGNLNQPLEINYEYQGISTNLKMYIDNTYQDQQLILWNLQENWQENRITVSKKVFEFWAYTTNIGMFVIYRRSDNIHWKIYDLSNGEQIFGGFLMKQDSNFNKLKEVYFAPYKKGAFCSLVFYDNINRQSYYIYYLDIWGRHDMVSKKEAKK